MDGSEGLDTLVGGTGDDAYYLNAYDGKIDSVVENANEGTDTVYFYGAAAGATYTLAANVENAQSWQSGLNLAGNSLNNTLLGDNGNNVLNGGAGADTLTGYGGNDTYVVENAGDVVTEALNGGTDLVQSSVTHTLGANVENLTLTGTAAINGTGNTLDNSMVGNTANNTLNGGIGNDLLNGGASTDTLIGGVGNDTYQIGDAGDVVTELANEGTDTVQSSITYTLGANVENLALNGTAAINGTGNTLNNVLTGNAAGNMLSGGTGNDRLDGLGGADTLMGGTGNDTYILGRTYGLETVVENDATVGNTDIAQFMSGIATDQIWFRHLGNDLEVSIIGTGDKAMISNWYGGNQYHVEQFKTANGKTLLDSQVENLVNAMASFAPPAAGQTTLPPTYQTSLSTVIAANWQ